MFIEDIYTNYEDFHPGICDYCTVSVSEMGSLQCEDCLALFDRAAVRAMLKRKHKLFNPENWKEVYRYEYELLLRVYRLYRKSSPRLRLRRYHYLDAETIKNSRAFFYA